MSEVSEVQQDRILAIDEELAPKITAQEAEALKPIQKKFMESYLEHRDKVPVEEWLRSEMAANLPERSAEEIAQMSDEIITTLKVQEEKKASLAQAIANGKSKEAWFASEAKKAMSSMSTQEQVKYLQGLDEALKNANESLYRTLQTQAGMVSQNPNLDGFIAEQYHAQTFNLNAEAAGSPYRAKVLEPDGTGYGKNSVDIEIVDKAGKVVRRYQAKYCKDAEATAQAFEQGDYRGQQKLVPQGQEQGIAKKTTTVIEAPDGTTSTPLPKQRAKELQREAQSGKWNDLNWNEYRAKDLAMGIGKRTGQAALMGAAVGVGFDVARKVWNGEEIKGEELVKTAITTGADFGVKTAAAGALKVGAEKGLISVIPKGTPAGTVANIAFVAVENAKIIGKMVTGELTVKEGLDRMGQTTASTVAGISATAKGTAVGAAIGSALGPVGTAVGGFIGGTIGYMAGSKVGEAIYKGAKKICKKGVEIVKSVGRAVSKVTSWVADKLGGFVSWLFG